MADDRLDELERRIAALEGIVRQLLAMPVTAGAARQTRDIPLRGTALESVAAPLPPPASRVVVKPKDELPSTPREPIVDWEQWVGQRGLLAVGVAALLIAAAFFLKYAFDRGWIPPIARSTGAVVLGIALAAWGHDRIRRGMRRFGAAMIGAGGGLVYLGLWAAAGPYALMERRVGILLLAATTIAVTYLAIHHEIEGLAIWALCGAYLAPIILASTPNPLGFLTYLEVIGLGTALTAYAMGWRATLNLALLGYLMLASAGASRAIATPVGSWLIAAAAILTLHITARRSWPEARVGVLVLAWAILGVGLADLTGSDAPRALATASAAAMWGLLWWQQIYRDPFDAQAIKALKREDALGERFLFVANPVALLLLVNAADFRALDGSFEVVPATLAAAYLPVGWIRRSAAHLIAAFLLVALAMLFPWQPATIVIGWTALAGLALVAEREGGRPGGRRTATFLASAAGLFLFSAALFTRTLTGPRPVFTDPWAVALYLYLLGTAALARWWEREDRAQVWNWILCGAALFTGGSILFPDYFGRITALAGDLALSVWWLLFAGGLVFLGFRLNHKLVRSTGLGVAALAALKIVLFDLSTLRALYRVGSFFVLAIIALAVAYAYNNKARAEKQAVS